MNFNVALDKWIPVLENDSRILVSPKELFTNDYKSLCADPVETYCILKFLIVLSHSSKQNQPNDIQEWRELKNTFSENVLKYIDENSSLFEMFGENPFLQYSTLVYHTDELRLREVYCGGINPVLYQAQTKLTKTIEQIVVDLIVHQNFSMTFARNVPASRAIMYEGSTNGNLNFYATLDTIKNTIWYNMFYGVNFGQPVWEVGFDQTKTTEFLNSNFPLTVKLKITEDLKKMMYEKGLVYPENKDNTFFSIVPEKYKTKEVQRPMSIKENFKFWSDFNIILSKKSAPSCLSDSKCRETKVLNVCGLGCTISSNSGFSRTDDFKHFSYEIKNPEKLHDSKFQKFYQKMVTTTEFVQDRFKFSIKNAVSLLRSKDTVPYTKGEDKEIWSTYVNPITNIFMNLVDKNTDLLLSYAGDEVDELDWNQHLKKYIETALSTIISKNELVLYHNITSSVEYLTIMKTLNKKDQNV